MRILLLTLALCLLATPARADCSGPAGIAGEIMYNADYATMQFCDGTTWWSMKGGGGGASNLAGLSDVDNALAPDDGEILVYDSAGGKWVTGSAGLASETDPQVGATTNNQWCRGDGSAVQCDQAAPGGDDLGNHTATQNLNLGTNQLLAGWERKTSSGAAPRTVTCSSGRRVIGGGGRVTSGCAKTFLTSLDGSSDTATGRIECYPDSDTSFTCECATGQSSNVTVYVICARIQ